MPFSAALGYVEVVPAQFITGRWPRRFFVPVTHLQIARLGKIGHVRNELFAGRRALRGLPLGHFGPPVPFIELRAPTIPQ